MTAPGYAIGVDVGATFTAAATFRDGRAEAVTLGDHGDVIPSVVFLREDDVLLVGDVAERRAVADATRVARAFKRRIGDDVPLSLGGRPHTAEALTAAIVGWVVDLVTAREGGPPERTVLTLPASWHDHRRDLLLDAAAHAGVADVELLAEPVAAAVHYAARNELPPDAMVGIYDLGGGTFDATIVRRVETGFATVGEPQGDDHLGGIDFDTLVWDHVVGVIGADRLVPDDPSPHQLRALARVRAAAVDAKEALSYDTQAIVPVALTGLMTEVRITRAEFEEMVQPDLLRTVEVFARTCALAGVAPADLHAVLLVGGSSRIPLVTQLVANELGARVAFDAHPKLATCLGAARAAGTLERAPRTAAASEPEPAPAPLLAPVEPPPLADTEPVELEGPPDTDRRRGPSRSRSRRMLGLAALATVAGTAAVFGVLQLGDPPTGPAGGEETATTTTTDPASTTSTAGGTTSTGATTTAPPDGASGTDGSTPPETTSTTRATTTSTTSTTVAPLTPGEPCDPADGNPDCTDSGGGGFEYVVGYADCVAENAEHGLSAETCADLDGDGTAGYPDSG